MRKSRNAECLINLQRENERACRAKVGKVRMTTEDAHQGQNLSSIGGETCLQIFVIEENKEIRIFFPFLFCFKVC